MIMSSKESLNLSQEQRLQQRLSPLQVKYVKLLELNAPEVEEAVERELEENPALVCEDVVQTSLTDDGEPFGESAEQIQRADYASTEDIPFAGVVMSRKRQFDFDPMTNTADSQISLYDYIMQYLSEREMSSDETLAAEYIAGNIDNNGYLTRSVRQIGDDLAINEGKDLSEDVLRAALKEIRSIEPAGIGAENLQQCLLLQLDRLPISVRTRDARRIVSDYFEAFSMKHYHKIESALRMSRERFDSAVAKILSLNPKPGAAIGGG